VKSFQSQANFSGVQLEHTRGRERKEGKKLGICTWALYEKKKKIRRRRRRKNSKVKELRAIFSLVVVANSFGCLQVSQCVPCRAVP
jgi:hypothetical protein